MNLSQLGQINYVPRDHAHSLKAVGERASHFVILVMNRKLFLYRGFTQRCSAAGFL